MGSPGKVKRPLTDDEVAEIRLVAPTTTSATGSTTSSSQGMGTNQHAARRAACATSCRKMCGGASTSSASSPTSISGTASSRSRRRRSRTSRRCSGSTAKKATLIFKILKRGEGAETGEADLALRYDLTVPLARVVAEYRGKLPKFFKRYQVQPVWRADRPQKGRFREFYQCDVDAIGSTSMVVEAELLRAVERRAARAWDSRTSRSA